MSISKTWFLILVRIDKIFYRFSRLIIPQILKISEKHSLSFLKLCPLKVSPAMTLSQVGLYDC